VAIPCTKIRIEDENESSRTPISHLSPKTMRSFFLLFAALSVWLILLPGTARAQRTTSTAEVTFQQGLDRFEALDYAGALPLFRQALQNSGSPNARLYVARCLRELGRLPEAYDETRQVARDAAERSKVDKRFASTRAAAASDLAELERRVGRIVVVIPSAEPGLEVSLDGTRLTEQRLGESAPDSPIPVEPGEHTLTAAAPHKALWSQRLRVETGSPTRVTIPPLATPPSLPPRRVDPQPRAAVTESTGTSPWLLVGLGTIAGAGATLGTVFGIRALGKDSEASDHCRDRVCDQQGIDLHDTAQGSATVSTIAFGIGVAAVVTGAVVWFATRPKRMRPAAVGLFEP
jgi:hypothetical protein